MESAPLLGILSSWEVIVACLLLMLLLPFVFALASARSPRRPPPRSRRVSRISSAPAPRAQQPPADADEET